MAARWRKLVCSSVLVFVALFALVSAAVALPTGGSVSGVVRDSQSTAVVPAAQVELWDWAGGLDPVATTTAGALGDYSFSGIAPGTYEVWAGTDSYFWGSATTTFTVTTNETFTRDIALDPIPDLSGTVYDQGTNPVVGVCVTAWYQDFSGNFHECGWATTDSSGAFNLKDIGPGDYVLTFDGAGYFSATYPDRGYREMSSGTQLSVLDTDVTGVTMHIKPAVGTGTLQVRAVEYPPGTTTMTGVDGVFGTYTLLGGSPVAYRTGADGIFASQVPAGEYDLDLSKLGYYSDVQHITVGTGSTGSATVCMYRTPPSITGLVKDTSRHAVVGITVGAYKLSASGWNVVATTTTDGTGAYVFAALEPGSYRVGIAPNATDSAGAWWRAQFWPAAADVASATNVVVEYAVETSNVDLTVARRMPAATGRVSDYPGTAHPGALVELIERDGATYRTVAQATTGADGQFSLYGLEGHVYRVKASAAGRMTKVGPEWTFTGQTGASSLMLYPGADITAPSLQCNVLGNRSALVTVTVSSSDSCGVPNVVYTVNGSAPKPCPSTLTFSVPGEYDITVTTSDFSGNTQSRPLIVWVTQGSLVSRIGGANRYDVAVNMAANMKSNMAYADVVVACGEDRAMADPLGAAALAGAYGCPVLLTPTAKANPSTIAAIKSMRDANGGRIDIHVVGGTRSIPKAVFDAFAAARGSGGIERIDGANRYDLAYRIAARTKSVLESKGKSVPGVIIVNIENPASFNDALAASPISAHSHMPLIGVKGASVPAEAAAALALFPGRPRYALNAAYLSAQVRSSTGAGSVVTGSKNREAAAVDIAMWGVANGFLRYETIGIVNKLSDALPAGSVMGQLDGPLLYVPGELSTTTRDFIRWTHVAVRQSLIFGGSASVSDNAMGQIASLLAP